MSTELLAPIYRPVFQRANLSKQNVDVTMTLVDVYRIFQSFQALTLESVSFKSRNIDVTSTFANVDPSILLVDV